MNVVLDVSFFGRAYRDKKFQAGIFRYMEGLCAELARNPEIDLAFAALYRLEETEAYLRANPLLRDVPVLADAPFRRIVNALCADDDRLESGKLGKLSHLAVRLHRRALKERADRMLPANALQSAAVFHSTVDALPPSLRGVHGLRRFITIYDLIPVLFPEAANPMFEAAFNALDADTWVIAISEATKNDLCERYPVDPNKVFVTPLAADTELFYACEDTQRIAAVRERYHIPAGPYILSLSTLESRKNIEHLIRSFARLVTQEKISDLQLVLAGSRGWRDDTIFEEIEGLGDLRGRIVVTGRVEDADMAPLFSGCLAFAYPSLYEGFGLPPLEAMQCGVPVITSNVSSLPEVVGDAGFTVDPKDQEALCDCMLRLYRDEALCADYSCRSLARAKQFSWKRCAEDTFTAYRAAAAS